MKENLTQILMNEEVVSKRWHNLFYILSSAILSFG